MRSGIGPDTVSDFALAESCVSHAQLFFNRPDLDLATARPGQFALTPVTGMVDTLRQDYLNMSNMIFGEVPDFDSIFQAVQELEQHLNSG